MKDANLKVTTALPAAGASNNSAAIDLKTAQAGNIPFVGLEVYVPATPNLANTKLVTLTVQESDDNSSWAAAKSVAAVVVTGPASGGGVETRQAFNLPLTLKRYIRLNQAVEASGGDSTAVSTELALTF